MKLKVMDRLMLMQEILPERDDLFFAEVRRDIIKKVAIPKTDYAILGIKESLACPTCGAQPGLVWDADTEVPAEREFEKAELAYLKQQVERVDKEKRITDKMFDVCKAIKEEK